MPHSEKCGALGKMFHNCKNVQHLEKCTPLEKCDALGKMGSTWKNVAHLEKCGALGKM